MKYEELSVLQLLFVEHHDGMVEAVGVVILSAFLLLPTVGSSLISTS